jgi:polysaccharide export outer membrane protein
LRAFDELANPKTRKTAMTCDKERRVKLSNLKNVWSHGRNLMCLAALSFALIGCEADSFLDPTVTGRWEDTNITLPILDRLDLVNETDEEIPGLSHVMAEDLIPEVKEYVIGPGDSVYITIFELINPGAESAFPKPVDELGKIRLPMVGEVKAAGLTAKQLEQTLVDILDPNTLRNPIVSVLVTDRRQRTFSFLGGGTFAIVKNNFRLTDAISMANLPIEGLEKIYVIRQIALQDYVREGFEFDRSTPGTHAPPLQKTPSDTGASETAPVADPGALIESLAKSLDDPDAAPAQPETPAKPANPSLTGALEPGANATEGRYIYVNGRWAWVDSPGAPGAPGSTGTTAAATPGAPASVNESGLPPIEMLGTQRVIEVDAEALVRGEFASNIVIRPDDIIRIPPIETGNIFVTGPGFNGGGTYGLQPDGMTLKQLIAASGGFSQIARPERMDITRRIGKNQEVTVRVNYRAIAEGVAPDFYLKPNDIINVGSDLLSSHLAVIRNSFRFSYGMGFLMDRNFGADVFGNELSAGR